uniref:SHSP domain-containing protein n=1 Tax=Bursaphelenchus xylophilus TaxID=6326 RepID=A0A1I7S800_BURXY
MRLILISSNTSSAAPSSQSGPSSNWRSKDESAAKAEPPLTDTSIMQSISWFIFMIIFRSVYGFSEVFPTQVLSAYGARGPLRNGGKNEENDILEQRISQLQTAPPDYNIGVIQVRLSNWTTTPPPRPPMTSALQSGPETPIHPDPTRRVKTRPRQQHRRRPSDNPVQYDDDYVEITPKPKMAPIDNTFLYMLAAILLGLVLLTTTIYSIMWCMSCRRSRPDNGVDMPTMTFPPRYQYYDSSPWHGSEHRGSSEMERLFSFKFPTYLKMSLLLWDPFRSSNGYALNPWRALDSELHQLERNLGQWDFKDGFTFSCNVQGFKPDEIEVNHQGDAVTISAHHKQAGPHEQYERTLKRTIRIPDGYEKEKVQCDLNEKGELVIKAPKIGNGKESEKRSIPINFKKSKAVEHKKSDLEFKRPPLVAPPPPPPRVPPPPVPQHLRPHPSYQRRRPHYTHRDSPVEREIRLQMLKRQISESTLSTRTRTNSF